MVTYRYGSIFDIEASIYINTVNCVGVMGKGIALEFKQRYPEMFDRYVEKCKKGEYKPGEPHVDNQCEGTTIINFPTKNHWRYNSQYQWIENGLLWLRDFLKDKPNVIVSMPALGCGNGNLDWNKISEMIDSTLNDLNCLIIVAEPK